MAFFARPDLSNEQFKQLVGSELTLSGQTQIATTSGLTLTDGAGGNVIVTASGSSSGTTGYILGQDIDGVIKLLPSAASGSSTYLGDSPTTCCVGGLTAYTAIYGCSVQDILEDILVPTLYPMLINPSISSFTYSPLISLYEVGTSISVTGTTVFNAGCINPKYTSASECRSDGASAYTYNYFGNITGVTSSLPSNIFCFGAHVVTVGNNTISSTIYYSGGTQPKDSSGGNYCTPLAASATTTSTKTITGVYPWYWGIEASGGAAAGVNRPSACCIKDVITGGTGNKVVDVSTGTICTTFNSTTDDYLWFATPFASTTKTCWYVDMLNNNPIGGMVSPGGELFPAHEVVSGITTTCWSNQKYKIYISNYQSAATSNMQLRNS